MEVEWKSLQNRQSRTWEWAQLFDDKGKAEARNKVCMETVSKRSNVSRKRSKTTKSEQVPVDNHAFSSAIIKSLWYTIVTLAVARQ